MLHDTWQDAITLTMDKLFMGTGWYEVEKKEDIYFRWSGPDTVSTVHVSPRRDQANRLNLTIYAGASEEVISGISIVADGIPLPVTVGTQRNPAFVTAILPENKSKHPGEKTLLTLKLPRTLPSGEIFPKGKKNRTLGIALQALNIFPLARPLFTTQKYNDPIPFDGIYYMIRHSGVRDAVIHGVYASAYEYFLKHDRLGSKDIYCLNETFDERPGDLYDIIKADLDGQYKKIINQQQEEIEFLRQIIYRQGDSIRKIKNHA